MDSDTIEFIESGVNELEKCLEWVYFREMKGLEKIKLIRIEAYDFCEEIQKIVFDKFFCAFFDIGQSIESLKEFCSVWGILSDLELSDELKKSMKKCLQGKLYELLSKAQCMWNKYEVIGSYLETLTQFEELFKTNFDFCDFFENFIIKFLNYIRTFQANSSVIYPVLVKLLEMPLSKLNFQEILMLLMKHSELISPFKDLVLTKIEISPVKTFKSLYLHHFQGFFSDSQKVSVFKYSSEVNFADFAGVNAEINTLKTVENHEFNICLPKFYGSVYKNNEIWIIQEHLNVSLKNFIEKSAKISEKMILMLPDLIRCFCHLNHLEIFHGSLRPDHIFFKEEFGFKLNLVSSILGRSDGRNHYSALWVKNDLEVDQRMISDVFSLGIILLEIFTDFRVNEDFKFSKVHKYLAHFSGPIWVKNMISKMMENMIRPNNTFNDILSTIPDVDTLLLIS